MELESLYQEVIMDHYKNPLNKKLLTDYVVQVHHINPSCGDEQDLNISTDGEESRLSGGTGSGVRSRKQVLQ